MEKMKTILKRSTAMLVALAMVLCSAGISSVRKAYAEDDDKTTIDKGQLVADAYNLQGTALADVFSSAAFNTGSVKVFTPDDTANIKIIENTLTAQNFTAEDSTVWVPKTAVMMKDGAPVVNTGTGQPYSYDFGGTNSVTFDAGVIYDNFAVTYVISDSSALITDAQVQKIVEDAAAIVGAAPDQLAAMDTLAGYAEKLAKIHNVTFQGDKISFNSILTYMENIASGDAEDEDHNPIPKDQDVLDAIADIRDNKLDAAGTGLDLYSMVQEFESKDEGEQLAYLYENYEKLLTIEGLGDDLRAISENQAIKDLVTDQFPAYADDFDDLFGIADTLDQTFETLSDNAPSDAITTTDAADLKELAENVVKAAAAVEAEEEEVPVYDANKTVDVAAEVEKPAPGKLTFTINLKVLDGKDKEITGLSGKKVLTWAMNYDSTLSESEYNCVKFDAAMVSEFAAAVNELVNGDGAAQLGVDQTHYYLADDKLPAIVENATTEASKNYTITFKPYKYQLEVKSEAEAALGTVDFYYSKDASSAVLPAASEAGMRYEYSFGAKTGVTGTYKFTDTELDALFGTAAPDNHTRTSVAHRKDIDVQQELILKFVDELNGHFGPNYKGIAFVPLDSKGDGKVDSILVRCTVENPSGYLDVLAQAAQVLTLNNEYSKIELNGETFLENSKVSLQAAIDAILASGFSMDTLEGMLDENGNNNHNMNGFEVVPSGSSIYTKGKTACNELGYSLGKAVMSLYGEENCNVDLYVSLEDFGASSKLGQVKNLIVAAASYVDAKAEDGAVTVTIESEKLYQLIGSAMVLTGDATLDDLAGDSADIAAMGEYAYGKLKALFEEKNGDEYTATYEAFAETLDKLNINLGHEDLLRLAFKLCAAAARRTEIENKSSEAGKWSFTATVDIYDAIVNAVNRLDTGLTTSSVLGLIKEYNSSEKSVKVNADFNLILRHSAYTAVALDPQAIDLANLGKGGVKATVKNLAKLFTFYKTADITVDSQNKVFVVLLADVDSVNISGSAVLDLNGHTAGSANAAGGLRQVDSANIDLTYASITREAGEDGVFNYTVSVDADAILKAESFSKAELTDMLKDLACAMVVNMLPGESGSVAIEGADTELWTAEFLDVLMFALDLKDNGPELADFTDFINIDGWAALANDILAKVVDFENFAGDLDGEGTEYSYTYEMGYWDVTPTAKDGYFTADVTAYGEDAEDAPAPRTGEIIINITSKESILKNMVEDLAKVLNTQDFADPDAPLLQIADGASLTAEGKTAVLKLALEGKFDFDLTATDEPAYLLAIAAAIAKATENADLEDAIADYCESGNDGAIHDAIADVTGADILKTLVWLVSNDFADASALITDAELKSATEEKEALYDDALRFAGRVINKFVGTDRGADATFESVEDADNYGYYKSGEKSFEKSVEKTLFKGYGAKADVTVTGELNVKLFNNQIVRLENPDAAAVYYNNFEDALADAEEGAVITILQAVELQQDAVIDKNITVAFEPTGNTAASLSQGSYVFILDNTDASLTFQGILIPDTEIVSNVEYYVVSETAGEGELAEFNIYRLTLNDEYILIIDVPYDGITYAELLDVEKAVVIQVDDLGTGAYASFDVNSTDFQIDYEGEITSADMVKTCDQIKIKAKNGSSSIIYTIVVEGDVNCDGKNNATDGSYILGYFFDELTAETQMNIYQMMAADTNGDGKLNATDESAIMAKFMEDGTYISYIEDVAQNDYQ